MSNFEFADGKILASIQDGVGRVVFNQPEKRNAMSVNMNVFCTALAKIGMMCLLSPTNSRSWGSSFKLPMRMALLASSISSTLPSVLTR